VKEEVYTSSFLYPEYLEKLKKLRDSSFILMVAPYSPVSLFFLPKSVQNTPNIYFFEGLNSPNNALQEITMFLLFPQALFDPTSSLGSLCIRGNYIDTNIFLLISI